jgi:uncharacterized protein with PIN domain
MQVGENPRFLVDQTAGKLARWLRIFGLDVQYAATCEPTAVVRAARQSGRKTITRNSGLAQRLGVNSILLRSEQLSKQIRQVLDDVGVSSCQPFTRCNVCNARLVEIPKEQVKGRVPSYVYVNHDSFSVCPICGRYYWQGTHWQKMVEVIREITEGKVDEEGKCDY